MLNWIMCRHKVQGTPWRVQGLGHVEVGHVHLWQDGDQEQVCWTGSCARHMIEGVGCRVRGAELGGCGDWGPAPLARRGPGAGVLHWIHGSTSEQMSQVSACLAM